MQCKTPVTITWIDPYSDWHWFWLRQKQGIKILLTGANSPDGTTHKGDSFWCNEDEIMVIKKGHIEPLFIPVFSVWYKLP